MLRKHLVFEGMLGQCVPMREVFELIRRIAGSESTVLVTGESGTGKEMVARAIHRHSRRCQGPLLACDCTALAPTLLESELFGHVKGAFSGAIATKKGLFEAAHGGSLLLDEVANLSPETQGKLLRVLETRRLRKVGATEEQEVNIRLIATTNRSLGEMVKAGVFRADLYYRLNVVPVTLPPLRERRGDVPLLATAFPLISFRSMVISIAAALEIKLPTPKESAPAAAREAIRSGVRPPETMIFTLLNPARSSRALVSFTRPAVTPPLSPGVSSLMALRRLPRADATRRASSVSSLKVSTKIILGSSSDTNRS